MHFKTCHQNNSWMSTVDKHGYGNIIAEDFTKLMENHGFRVDDAQTIPLKYKFEESFIKNYFKSVVLTSFPELQGETRKKFFTEFIPRVKELNTLVSFNLILHVTFHYTVNSHHHTGCGGILRVKCGWSPNFWTKNQRCVKTEECNCNCDGSNKCCLLFYSLSFLTASPAAESGGSGLTHTPRS